MPNSQYPAHLKILVSNDDGITSQGIRVLEKIAREISSDVWTVAPEREQSAASHSLSVHLPVRLRKLGTRRYAVSGTPTDCVLLGIKEVIPSVLHKPSPLEGEGRVGGKPLVVSRAETTPPPAPSLKGRGKVDLILSGINHGSNVGDDITYSGTVAAAMEGAMLGVPAIAFSQMIGDKAKLHWETPPCFAPDIIRKLLKAKWPPDVLYNVNFPNVAPDAVKGVKLCAQGKRAASIALDKRTDPKGRSYFWIGGARDDRPSSEGVDIDWLNQGYVTVTPLRIDLTDYGLMKELNQELFT